MLLVGLVLLVKGADWLVDGASFFASNIGVSDLIIGLTIAAFRLHQFSDLDYHPITDVRCFTGNAAEALCRMVI